MISLYVNGLYLVPAVILEPTLDLSIHISKIVLGAGLATSKSIFNGGRRVMDRSKKQ
jgi:hypothetical protein